MRLNPGDNFSGVDVEREGKSVMIDVITVIDDRIEGGMSYQIDPLRIVEPLISLRS